jgi:streptogramin lyase
MTKDQYRFLELLASQRPPEWFGWKQASATGKLSAAHGHPSQWTHFQAMRGGADPEQATITKAELAWLTDAGFVACCRITEAGRAALAAVSV